MLIALLKCCVNNVP